MTKKEELSAMSLNLGIDTVYIDLSDSGGFEVIRYWDDLMVFLYNGYDSEAEFQKCFHVTEIDELIKYCEDNYPT